MTTTAHQTTSDQARTFPHFSVHNALQAEMACPEGSCQSYRDIFTIRRWRAQGYVVRKGENGIIVTTYIADSTSRGGRARKGATLFCRHQVEQIARR